MHTLEGTERRRVQTSRSCRARRASWACHLTPEPGCLFFRHVAGTGPPPCKALRPCVSLRCPGTEQEATLFEVRPEAPYAGHKSSDWRLRRRPCATCILKPHEGRRPVYSSNLRLQRTEPSYRRVTVSHQWLRTVKLAWSGQELELLACLYHPHYMYQCIS